MDHNELDPSVEAFIAAQEAKRYKGSPVSTSMSLHAAPLWADADDLGETCGGVLRLFYPHGHRVVSFMPVDLSRDLAAAINTVLARHAEDEKPAHERVRDIVVDNELPF